MARLVLCSILYRAATAKEVFYHEIFPANAHLYMHKLQKCSHSKVLPYTVYNNMHIATYILLVIVNVSTYITI